MNDNNKGKMSKYHIKTFEDVEKDFTSSVITLSACEEKFTKLIEPFFKRLISKVEDHVELMALLKTFSIHTISFITAGITKWTEIINNLEDDNNVKPFYKKLFAKINKHFNIKNKIKELQKLKVVLKFYTTTIAINILENIKK